MAILEDQGAPLAAEPSLRRALDNARRISGERDPRTAAAYASLALNLGTQGRYAEAEPLLRKALAIRQRAPGDGRLELARAYNDLAAGLFGQGRHADAEKMARQALSIAQAGGGESSPATAAIYGNLALVLDATGRRAEAETLFRKALEIDRKALGERRQEVAGDNANLARNLTALGRYAEAEPLYRLSLDIDSATFGDNHYRVADDDAGLAALLDDLGRWKEAESISRRALETRRRAFGEINRNTAASYRQVAANLHLQGRYAEAEPLFRKALAIDLAVIGEKQADTAAVYHGLGVNLDAQGRHREAEPLLRKAVALRRGVLGEGAEDTAMSYASLGANLSARGAHKEAEKLYRRAVEIAQRAVGDGHPKTAVAYAGLAAELNAQQRFAAAEPFFRKALDIRRAALGEQHPGTAEAYDSLAQNLHLQSSHTQAEAFSTRAVAIVREQRSADLRVEGSDPDAAIRRARAADDRGISDDRIYARHLALAWLAARERPVELTRLRDEAFTSAQDLGVSPAGQALAQTVARTAAGGDAGVARRREALSSQARRLETELVKSLPDGDASDPTRLRLDLDSVGRELAAADVRLRQQNPRYADLASPTSLTPSQVQRRLRPGEGLLLIVPAANDIYVFAVSRTRVSWTRLANGQAEVARKIRTLRCQVDDGACGGGPASARADAGHASPSFDLQAAYELYRDLVAPVEDALQDADRLFITSSGPLATLPLSMLVTSAPASGVATGKALTDAHWLADRYALTTLPSVSNLRAAPARPAAKRQSWAFLGYGDPALTGPTPTVRRRGVNLGSGASVADPDSLRRAFPAIPGSGVELRAMAAALGAAPHSLRVGAQATEASIKTAPEMSRARVVDFATHSLRSNEVEGIDEPGLVFTPPGKPSAQDDGVLTASEAAQLKLTADWVILSACNTAGADGSPGADSLSGLARAFLYAGAKALLASHWHVFDDATAALSVETLTIQRANPRLTKSQALQRAMLVVRTGRRPDGSRLSNWSAEWAHPAYWAPFVLVSAGE